MRIGFAIVGLLLTASANAISVSEYQGAKKAGGEAWDTVTVYINGISTGYDVANAYAMLHKTPLIYCQPGKLTLNVDNLFKIIEEEITQAHAKPTERIEYVMLYGLQRTFPCSK